MEFNRKVGNSAKEARRELAEIERRKAMELIQKEAEKTAEREAGKRLSQQAAQALENSTKDLALQLEKQAAKRAVAKAAAKSGAKTLTKWGLRALGPILLVIGELLDAPEANAEDESVIGPTFAPASETIEETSPPPLNDDEFDRRVGLIDKLDFLDFLLPNDRQAIISAIINAPHFEHEAERFQEVQDIGAVLRPDEGVSDDRSAATRRAIFDVLEAVPVEYEIETLEFLKALRKEGARNPMK